MHILKSYTSKTALRCNLLLPGDRERGQKLKLFEQPADDDFNGDDFDSDDDDDDDADGCSPAVAH